MDTYSAAASDAPENSFVNAITSQHLDPKRLLAAKAAYTTRRIPLNEASVLLAGDVRPTTGDTVLARVARIRQHGRLELTNGRRAVLYPGDEILVCFGHRYAPDQYEALVPDDLGPCHLVAAGGVAARACSWHKSKKPPTEIVPLGLLGNHQGQRINLKDAAMLNPSRARCQLPAVAVVGTAMNSGKTTAAAQMIRGLKLAGRRVGAAKITGTGAGGDVWAMYDAGADYVVDFTDAGHVSTFGVSNDELLNIFHRLTYHLQQAGADVVVIEIADGLLQPETAQLLATADFRAAIDGVVFAAADAMGACSGVRWLQQHHHSVLALSGTLSASPLASREATQATGLPVMNRGELANPRAVQLLFRDRRNIAQPAIG